jgi:hypothetical protein
VIRPPSIFGKDDNDSIKENEINHKSHFFGVVFALIASVSSAGAYVLVRILGTIAKMPWENVCFAQVKYIYIFFVYSITICIYQFLSFTLKAIGQIVLAIPSEYITGKTFNFLNITYYQLSLIFIGGFVGAWSQVAMTIGMQREKSAIATAMRMSDVLFGFIWQVAFTADNVAVLSVYGAFLVTASILIIVFSKETKPNITTSDQGISTARNSSDESVVESKSSSSVESDNSHSLNDIEASGSSLNRFAMARKALSMIKQSKFQSFTSKISRYLSSNRSSKSHIKYSPLDQGSSHISEENITSSEEASARTQTSTAASTFVINDEYDEEDEEGDIELQVEHNMRGVTPSSAYSMGKVPINEENREMEIYLGYHDVHSN